MAKTKSKRKTKIKRNIFADIFTGVLIMVLIAGLILTSMQWQSWFGEEPAPVPQSIEFILANKNDVTTLTQNEDGTLALPTIVDDTFVGFYTSDGTEVDSTTVFGTEDDVFIVATYGEAVVTSNVALVIDGNMYDTITTTNSELTFANLPTPTTVYTAGEKDMYYTYEYQNQRFTWEDVNGNTVDAQNPLALNGNTVLFGTFTWDNATADVLVTEALVDVNGTVLVPDLNTTWWYPVETLNFYIDNAQAFYWAEQNNYTVIGFYWDINHTQQISGTDLQELVTQSMTYYALVEEQQGFNVTLSYYNAESPEEVFVETTYIQTGLVLDTELLDAKKIELEDQMEVQIISAYNDQGEPFDFGQEITGDVTIVFETIPAYIVNVYADSETQLAFATVEDYEGIAFTPYENQTLTGGVNGRYYLDPTMSDYFAIVITNETLTGVNVSYSLDTMFYDVAGDQALVFVGNGLYGTSGTTYITVV